MGNSINLTFLLKKQFHPGHRVQCAKAREMLEIAFQNIYSHYKLNYDYKYNTNPTGIFH